MKVIKKPDTSHWTYKYLCVKCDSELEVEASDLKYTYYPGDMRESSTESYTATCAVCSGNFTVPKDKIPKLIQIEVQQKRTSSRSSGGGYWDR